MIVIGWMNSPISLQRFCAAITFGSGLTMEIFPAIDQFELKTALGGDKIPSRLRPAERGDDGCGLSASSKTGGYHDPPEKSGAVARQA